MKPPFSVEMPPNVPRLSGAPAGTVAAGSGAPSPTGDPSGVSELTGTLGVAGNGPVTNGPVISGPGARLVNVHVGVSPGPTVMVTDPGAAPAGQPSTSAKVNGAGGPCWVMVQVPSGMALPRLPCPSTVVTSRVGRPGKALV